MGVLVTVGSYGRERIVCPPCRSKIGRDKGGATLRQSSDGKEWASPENGQSIYPGPVATMIMDANGNLYGTTAYDGADGLGTVFKLSTDGHGGYLYTDLHDFTYPSLRFSLLRK